MAKTKFFMDKLQEYAWEYIEECLENTKEQLSNKGDVVDIKERNNPTIDFFLMIWIPMRYKKNGTMGRTSWYRWKKVYDPYIISDKDIKRKELVDRIEKTFNSLNLNIAANEGKGIAYLKYKFGWTDKTENKNENTNIEVKAEFGVKKDE